MEIQTTVNGAARRDEIEDRLLLVHYVRDACGLTATNVGCDTTSCGACTVLLDGESVKSCTVLAAQADGREVTTVEGLGGRAGGDPIQRAFADAHAFQCGWCTPGFVLAAKALVEESAGEELSDEAIAEGLGGNLCRCGSYVKIAEAVRRCAS
jgi:carbon-monoxide dehydrogenase small subunit